ncbi:MAG: MBOAT family protein [Anaerolineales bacterium]|nr:MBOAT family protein [Anaerolineales bacterium]
MTLLQLGVFALLALLGGALVPPRARGWLLLAASVLALYWLQPLTPLRSFDFWFPTATLALTVFVWAATQPVPAPPARVPAAGAAAPPAKALPPAPVVDQRDTLVTAGVLAALVVLIALLRYLGPLCCLTPDRPPALLSVLTAVAVVAALAALLWRVPHAGWLWGGGVVLLLALFVALKTEPLGRALSAGLRALNGQSPGLALAADLRWLGFSYVAFRLLHVLRDRALGRLPAVSLREFVTYALFFPALTAGPIDRVERFVKDTRGPFKLDPAGLAEGGARLVLGVFKKFVLADSLALAALNATNAAQTTSTLWLWVLVYAYAWRLYLDFSGYTDIALGVARLAGVRLPENFDRPYTRPNLTLFWNSWHITLSQWFRAYVFNPLTRWLRARPLPAPAIIFLTQFVVMLLIGLWHGVTLNFVLWGLWHGLGLFIHNRWADFTKPRAAALDGRPRLKLAAHWLGVFLTFHFVTLGWVWFVLPTPALALRVFGVLFGLG